MEEYNAYVGLDVHKDTIAVALAYPGREKAESRGFIPNSKKAVMKLVRRRGTCQKFCVRVDRRPISPM